MPKLPQVDVINVDMSLSPCTNFYQYVCGTLNAVSPIPLDQIFWGPAEQLEEWDRLVLRQILEENLAADEKVHAHRAEDRRFLCQLH